MPNIKPMYVLDREIANDKISMPYPHVKILEPGDALALVLPSLPKGDVPIICEYNSKVRRIASIELSALHLNTLRSITKIEYHKDANTEKALNSSEDIMEAVEEWMQLSS